MQEEGNPGNEKASCPTLLDFFYGKVRWCSDLQDALTVPVQSLSALCSDTMLSADSFTNIRARADVSNDSLTLTLVSSKTDTHAEPPEDVRYSVHKPRNFSNAYERYCSADIECACAGPVATFFVTKHASYVSPRLSLKPLHYMLIGRSWWTMYGIGIAHLQDRHITHQYPYTAMRALAGSMPSTGTQGRLLPIIQQSDDNSIALRIAPRHVLTCTVWCTLDH